MVKKRRSIKKLIEGIKILTSENKLYVCLGCGIMRRTIIRPECHECKKDFTRVLTEEDLK